MPTPTTIDVTYSLGATSSPRRRTQEAITPSPRFTCAADARGYPPRMNTRIATLNANADARGNPPRMITRSAASGVVADACGNSPQMITRSAVSGVVADACGNSPQMITRSAASGVVADACGNSPQMITRSAVSGVVADACDNSPQMITCGLTGPQMPAVYKPRTITRVSPPGRRGRPDPQNRTGISGITGRAEGSMSRLAPIGQDLELPSASGRLRTTRLLNMRPFSVPASMKTPAPGIGQIWGLASVRRAARVFYPTIVPIGPATALIAFETSHTRAPPLAPLGLWWETLSAARAWGSGRFRTGRKCRNR